MHSIKRRALLTLLPVMAAAMVLSACGFQLRGTDGSTSLPFKTLYLNFPESSPLGVELRRYIRADGGTRVVGDPKEAEAVVDMLSEGREENIVSLNSQGRIRELALIYRFSFRVRTPSNKEILPSTEIALKRNMSFNESEVLAKESEKALLYRDMQSDAVQQILRRLAALKPAT